MDFGIYFAHVGRTRKLEEFACLDYSLMVKNYQIYEFLIPCRAISGLMLRGQPGM